MVGHHGVAIIILLENINVYHLSLILPKANKSSYLHFPLQSPLGKGGSRRRGDKDRIGSQNDYGSDSGSPVPL